MNRKRFAIFGAFSLALVGTVPAVAFAADQSSVKLNTAVSQQSLVTEQKEGPKATGLIVKFKTNSAEAKEIRSFATARSNSRSVPNAYEEVKKAAKKTGVEVKSYEANALNTTTFKFNKVVDEKTAKTAVKKISELKNVEFVEPDLRMYALANEDASSSAPNDPRYKDQWDLKNTKVGIGLEGAWKHSKGRGVTVAVIDTGIINHPDLHTNVVGGYDFISDRWMARDEDGRDADYTDNGDWLKVGECGGGSPRKAQTSSWHGSHVAGTIAAIANNKEGITGIAPESNILVGRVLGRCGGTSSDIADAITWTTGGSVPGMPKNEHPARVVNMSLGGYSRTCPKVYQQAIDAAVSRGAVIVVAAGNETQDARLSTPANCNNVITVGATGEKGNQSYFSNFGPRIDVSAPGGDYRQGKLILSTVDSSKTSPKGATYGDMQGTSQAAPHVAGLVALMLSAKPSLKSADVLDLLKENTKEIGSCPSGACGAGIIDATKTMNAVVGDDNSNPNPGEPDEPENPDQPTPDKPEIKPVLELNKTQFAAGENMNIKATGFTPGEKVSVFVDSSRGFLGTVTADKEGAIYAHWKVNGLYSGGHRLYVYGHTSKATVYKDFGLKSSTYYRYW